MPPCPDGPDDAEAHLVVVMGLIEQLLQRRGLLGAASEQRGFAFASTRHLLNPTPTRATHTASATMRARDSYEAGRTTSRATVVCNACNRNAPHALHMVTGIGKAALSCCKCAQGAWQRTPHQGNSNSTDTKNKPRIMDGRPRSQRKPPGNLAPWKGVVAELAPPAWRVSRQWRQRGAGVDPRPRRGTRHRRSRATHGRRPS